MDAVVEQIKKVSEWYSYVPNGSDQEIKTYEIELRTRTIEAISKLRARPSMRTRIKNCVLMVIGRHSWRKFNYGRIFHQTGKIY